VVTVTVATVLLFALIALGLCADVISTTQSLAGSYYGFTALGVATAVMTLISVARGTFRTGFFDSSA